jgi:hypothetical protein
MEKIGLKVNPKSTEYLVPPTVIKKQFQHLQQKQAKL